MPFVKMHAAMLMLALFFGCGNMADDLRPSGTDIRPPSQPGTTGSSVGQNAPDFTLSDTLGNSVTLSAVIPTVPGVVLYFTMWCPTCDGHMSGMLNSQVPAFPNVRFYVVDYVSGTVAASRNEELANGYAGTAFTVLADTRQSVASLYDATMGTTVVIDGAGIVRMNEDYGNGARLQAVLAALP